MMKNHQTLGTALVIAAALSILSGCASLTKSQMAAVSQFGQTTKNFSAFPSKLYSSYIDIHEQALLYDANTYTSPEEHYKALKSAYDLKKRHLEKNAQLDLTFKIIDKYGQALVLLTSDKHGKQLDTAAQKAGNSLDGLVTAYNKINTTNTLPTGIGSLVSGLISAGGNVYIHQKQADLVKDLVPKADALINTLMDALFGYLKGGFENTSGNDVGFADLLKAERQEIKNDYTSYLGLHMDEVSLTDTGKIISLPQIVKGKSVQQDAKVNLKLFGYVQQRRFAALEHDKDCIKMLSDLDILEKMYAQTLKAIDELKTAHQKLVENIQQRKTLQDITVDLQAYGTTVDQLYDTFKGIKK